MGKLTLMDETGDTKATWNADNPDEVETARRTFTDLKKKGYTAFRVFARDGSRAEEMREFDPAAEAVIMMPRMAGG